MFSFCSHSIQCFNQVIQVLQCFCHGRDHRFLLTSHALHCLLRRWVFLVLSERGKHSFISLLFALKLILQRCLWSKSGQNLRKYVFFQDLSRKHQGPLLCKITKLTLHGLESPVWSLFCTDSQRETWSLYAVCKISFGLWSKFLKTLSFRFFQIYQAIQTNSGILSSVHQKNSLNWRKLKAMGKLKAVGTRNSVHVCRDGRDSNKTWLTVFFIPQQTHCISRLIPWLLKFATTEVFLDKTCHIKCLIIGGYWSRQTWACMDLISRP